MQDSGETLKRLDVDVFVNRQAALYGGEMFAAAAYAPCVVVEVAGKAACVNFAAENQKKDLEAQKDKLTQQLTEWRSLLQPLFERYSDRKSVV